MKRTKTKFTTETYVQETSPCEIIDYVPLSDQIITALETGVPVPPSIGNEFDTKENVQGLIVDPLCDMHADFFELSERHAEYSKQLAQKHAVESTKPDESVQPPTELGSGGNEPKPTE